ncbi:MAG: HAMP domain-containing sensor histidine kinase, partial [Hyphomicrobium sp.]
DAIEAAVPPHASADHPLHRDPADHVPGAHPLPAERAAASEIILPAPQQVMRANAHNQDWADLMARVSHELRTPLNAVLGFSDLMDRGLYGPLGHQRYQEYARHIHESGRDLLKSAEDTLAVTSLLTAPSRHAPTEVVDLADLTADAWAFFGKLPQSKAVSLATEIPAGTEIMCERRSMRQVLVNLLSEALTRSGPGTTVTLHASLACGQIGLQVAVPFADNQSQREPGSLDVCLARTLLEFHGTTLSEHLSEQAGWRATTYLERADQADFFAPAIPAARPLYVFA